MFSLTRLPLANHGARIWDVLGVGQLGHFDPAHEDHPSNAAVVYRVKSVVDIDLFNNADLATLADWWGVSTVLEGSGDNGATWGVDVMINRARAYREGMINLHEVPFLYYDANAAADERWKCVWLDSWKDSRLPAPYFDSTRAVIAYKSAPDPAGPWSEKTNLIAGTAFTGSAALADVGGPVITEPGGCVHPSGGMYFVYNLIANTANPADEVTKLCRLYQDVNGDWQRTDITASLFNIASDVAYFHSLNAAFPSTFPDWGATVNFTACDIVKVGVDYYLLFCPQDTNSKYIGWAAVKFTNINAGTLERDGSSNLVLAHYGNTAGLHHGPAGYSSQSTGSGIVISVLDDNLSPPFALAQSGANLPP